jgi:hypothetical protein
LVRWLRRHAEVGSRTDHRREHDLPGRSSPFCGKDGMKYSNVCEAGGRRNVAYQGECIDACISATCPEGTECSTNRNGDAVCSPIEFNPCSVVRCGADAPTCLVRGNKAVCI